MSLIGEDFSKNGFMDASLVEDASPLKEHCDESRSFADTKKNMKKQKMIHHMQAP